MALINVGAGLAELGKNVAATAGAWTLESQRAEAEKEKATLIDQLTGAREEKGRVFQKGEREATQTFTSGEKEKDRTFQGAEGDKTRATQVQTAGISAGATIRAQQIAAESALTRAQLDDKFRRDELSVKEKSPAYKSFKEREAMDAEEQARFDKHTQSLKEPKTPYKFNANDGNPVVINEQTGEVKSGTPEGGPSTGGKRLEVGERKELKSMADPAISLSDLTNAFRPTYGGAPTEWLGNLANKYGRDFSGAPQDVKDAANWWQQYQRFSNIEQNALYGAALSKMEQDNFVKAMVTPNMTPAMIKANLERQQDIALTALARYSQSLVKDGYRADSIEAITGLRFYGNERNYSQMPAGTIYIAPNGKVMRKQAPLGNL